MFLLNTALIFVMNLYLYKNVSSFVFLFPLLKWSYFSFFLNVSTLLFLYNPAQTGLCGSYLSSCFQLFNEPPFTSLPDSQQLCLIWRIAVWPNDLAFCNSLHNNSLQNMYTFFLFSRNARLTIGWHTGSCHLTQTLPDLQMMFFGSLMFQQHAKFTSKMDLL